MRLRIAVHRIAVYPASISMVNPFGYDTSSDPTRYGPRNIKFGLVERKLLKEVPSSKHPDLVARSVKPLDIFGPTFLCPKLHVPWQGKDLEMDDWTERADYGKVPKYMSERELFSCSGGLMSNSGYSAMTGSATSRASHVSASAMSEATMRNTEHPLAWKAMRRRRNPSAGPSRLSCTSSAWAGQTPMQMSAQKPPSMHNSMGQSTTSLGTTTSSRPGTPGSGWTRSCTTFGLPHELRDTPRHVPTMTREQLAVPWRGGGVRPFPQEKCIGNP